MSGSFKSLVVDAYHRITPRCAIYPAGRSMAKKKRNGRVQQAMVYYIVQITEWDWDYHFSVNVLKWEDRRYSDYRHLLVRGNVVLPGKLKAGVEAAELIFMPDVRKADFEAADRPPPRGVGHLSISEGRLKGSMSMAADALTSVLQMLIAGRLKYAVLYGEPMRYRKALARSYQLVSKLDPKEFPDVTISGAAGR